MTTSFKYTSTEVVDDKEKTCFSASVAACYPVNYDLVLEFAMDDGAPQYSAISLIASKISIDVLLAFCAKLGLPTGRPGRWKPDPARRSRILHPRRAAFFHVSIASSHGIALVSAAEFDMLSLELTSPPGPVLNVPAFMSVSLNIEALADLLFDIRNWAGPT